MIYLKVSFKLLFYTYIGILGVLSIISLVCNIKEFKNIFNIKQVKKISGLSVVVVILVAMQVFMLCRYAHIDDDDAFYVATATTTVDTNGIFKYDGSTGQEGVMEERYTLGPFPIYLAIVSEFIDIRPAIVAHTIIPAIFIPIVYLIYSEIAKELFKKDKKCIDLFLIFLSVLYIWGNYSVRNNFTFLLFRIWQGKAVLANIILPAMWLFFIKAHKNDFNILTCSLLLILIFAGCLTTTMGIIMPSITLLVLAFLFSIKDKKISYLWKSIVVCIPCLIYGLIYIL